MFRISPKLKLRTHAALGISSVLLLAAKAILSIFENIEIIIFSPLILGRIGAIAGVAAFLTGGGLGKLLTEKRSKMAEIHMILMLSGLLLQVPSVSDPSPDLFKSVTAGIGLFILGVGWIYGRRIFRRTLFKFPWEAK
ncbi:hypothetical protein LEP1GSC047_3068 [Leptospira inadai serovar Lyme str. 10]|uniref:Uncharacterized protein n=2 Tax=Leptospira inadai serovar Lyme TaxID=293084 RepID=V6HB28_9LEPT|nr:hypothetical protein [Leptospira inadai]EQA36527.1 hypothetical protein LEP1GSC047_3068 [Leptospira inadai serovar Lyme str. 10]PNV75622.1 hypothetical protein BES34_008345 [Leptospira inadai serovar Lyme]